MEARLGQHSGVVTNAFENSTPSSKSRAETFGMMPRTVPNRWSSDTITIMLGRSSAQSSLGKRSTGNRDRQIQNDDDEIFKVRSDMYDHGYILTARTLWRHMSFYRDDVDSAAPSDPTGTLQPGKLNHY